MRFYVNIMGFLGFFGYFLKNWPFFSNDLVTLILCHTKVKIFEKTEEPSNYFVKSDTFYNICVD
jgi:hypothetical protein